MTFVLALLAAIAFAGGAIAALIALPGGRGSGLAIGALVIAAAIVTILRHRAFSHAAPLGVFAVLLALAATTS